MNNYVREIELCYGSKKIPNGKINNASSAVDFFRSIWAKDIEIRERAYAVYINNKGEVLGWYEISSGGLTGTVMDARLIYSVALKCLAASVVVAHNHPSGDLQPSRADREMTLKLKEGATVLDIKLLDHVIINADSFYSFQESGLI